MKEEIQKWWNRNPCQIINSNKQGIDFFEDVERVRYWMHPWIKNYFMGVKGKKILEVGCGIGTDLVNFVRYGGVATGIDMSDNSLELAEVNLKLNGFKAELILMDAENLEFKDNTFDIVYSYGVLHHTINTQKGIDEIHRVLNPKGTAIIMLYNKLSLVRLLHPNINKYEGRRPEEKEFCPLLKTYTSKEVKKMFSKFSSIKIDKRFVGNKLEGHIPDFIKKRIGWHIIIEAIK
ncbi:MAG: class I SAM-dependent methyltransferase [Candidatus Aenigmarchaeota archaeon]|nr:class I SAM-dependent methyltransferase [Candidatus Aenigmarchaeota archaeon]